MVFNSGDFIPTNQDRPQLEKLDHRVITMLSLLLMLALNFTFTYLVHTYYSDTFYDFNQLGFWLILANSFILWGLFLLCKRSVGWKWSHAGMGKPLTWWRPAVTFAGLSLAVVLMVEFLQPLVFSVTSPPDVTHFRVFEGNLPLVLSTLLYVWLHGAFLQELIFRAFFINTIDALLGRNTRSVVLAVLLSSLAFGLIHAWQGWGGILLTTIMGLLFGFAYLFNGRRIWPLILVHGIIDTLMLITFYNGGI